VLLGLSIINSNSRIN